MSYTKNSMIAISRTVANNSILSKYTIPTIPTIEKKDLEKEKTPATNLLRAMKRYPMGFDFLANTIYELKKRNEFNRWVYNEDLNYYTGILQDTYLDKYFYYCGNNTDRQSLKRQLLHSFETGTMIFYDIDKKGFSTNQMRPFFFSSIKDYPASKERFYFVSFSKLVFKSLINESCFNKGGDGYISLPSFDYPRITQNSKGVFNSYNPIYRLQIYSALKNPNQANKIEVSRDDFLMNVLPEYTRKRNGRLAVDLGLYETRKSFYEGINGLYDEGFKGIHINNLYIEKRKEKIILHYSKKE